MCVGPRAGIAFAAAAVSVAALAGCLERRETITIEPDGTATIEAVFETESQNEFYDFDALPSLAGAWLVGEVEEVEPAAEAGDSNPRYRLSAEARFPPNVPLSENFATPGDARGKLYLQFPTTLLIEQRKDGVYYHFNRRYIGRPWAAVASLQELLLDEPTRDLKDKKPDELTVEDRRRLLRSYGEFESAKMLLFARQAFLEVTPDAPQDGWLAVAAEVKSLQDSMDYQRILKLADIEDEDERNRALEEATSRWRERAFKSLKDALRRHCDYDGKRLADFTAAYDARRFAYDVTADLSDETFEISVVLPGEIVGSNADATDPDRATWKFSGRRLRDADLELMATSRLAP